MTILDNTVPSQVIQVLATYGVTLSWIQNPNRPEETSYSFKASPPTGTYRSSGQVVSKTGNLMFVMSGTGLGFTPKAEDFVQYDGARWIVESIQPIPSGDSIAAYNVEIRR